MSIERNNSISFTIEPVEPYDFPVKEKDETKKCVLLQPVSGETKNGKHKADKSSTEKEELLKVPPSTRFSIFEKRIKCLATFGDLILLKQNRSKIQIEASETEVKNPSLNADKSDVHTAECQFSVLKLTVK